MGKSDTCHCVCGGGEDNVIFSQPIVSRHVASEDSLFLKKKKKKKTTTLKNHNRTLLI